MFFFVKQKASLFSRESFLSEVVDYLFFVIINKQRGRRGERGKERMRERDGYKGKDFFFTKRQTSS